MNEATFGILLDLSLIGFLALALALVTFGLVRRSNPLANWGSHGNVWTGPFNGIDVGVAVSFLLLYVMMVLFGTALKADATREPAEISMTVQLTSLIVMTLFLWGSVLFYLGVMHRINLGELFGLRRMKVGAVFGWGLVWFIAAFVVTILANLAYQKLFLEGVWPDSDKQEAVLMFQGTGSPLEKGLMIFSITILAPLYEETLYRGFIYPVIKKYSDRFFSIVFTSLMFALVHGNVPALAGLMVLAMMFTLAYEVTGCLWVPILMHCLFNSVQLVGLAYES